ncbi:hypothetical protein ACO0RG_000526 [Hanseniaspora osmophila]
MQLDEVNVNKVRINPDVKFVPTRVPENYSPPDDLTTTDGGTGASTASSAAAIAMPNAFIDGFEGYIDQSRMLWSQTSKTLISNNSMSMAPTVTRNEYDAVLRELNQLPTLDNNYKDGIDDSIEIKKKVYPQYAFELKQDFTLLFYGYGSKRNFLKELCEQYLSFNLNSIDGVLNMDDLKSEAIPVLHINGYNLQLSHRDIFAEVMKYIQVDDQELMSVLEPQSKNTETPEEDVKNDESHYDFDAPPKSKKRARETSKENKIWGNSINYELENLIKYYNITNSSFDKTFKLIVCIHSLDGPQPRRAKFISFLKLLAQINCIALVCSSDHMKLSLLYDHNAAVAFNFVYHDATNYRFYALEHSFQYDSFQTVYHDTQYVLPSASSGGMAVGSKKTTDNSNTLTGVKYVLDSLTKNSKKMYKLLLETILARKEKQSGRFNKAYRIEFKPFFDLCRDEFIVSNEMALRNMLREYVEHRMAAVTKNKRSGVEAIDVPYSVLEIDMILKEHMSNI